MGIFTHTWATFGAVGINSRMAGNLYLRLLAASDDSEVELNKFCIELISWKYSIGEPYYLGRAVLLTLLKDGDIRSICELVVLILVVEAGFRGYSTKVQLEFVKFIAATLRSRNVPRDLAFGEGKDGNLKRMLMSFQPSIVKATTLLRDIRQRVLAELESRRR